MSVSKQAVTLIVLAGLLCVLGARSNAGVVQLFSDPGFATVIDFDSLVDDEAVLDQFAGVGVRFRDTLSTFGSPAGGSPGDIDDEESFSPPNSLEVEDRTAFALFDPLVTEVGAFVMGDEDGTITLEAFDAASSSLGSVSVPVVEDAFVIIALRSDMGFISAVAFSHEEFYIDNLAFTPVPLPAALPLFLSALAGFGLLAWRNRRRAA